MYNTQLYNVGLYNGQHSDPIVLTSDDTLSFNGFSLSNGTTVVATDIFIEDMEKDFIYSQIPRGNGRMYQNSFYRNKRIKVRGNLTTSTQTELEDLIFEFKKQVYEPEGRLEFIRADGTRLRYTATLTNDSPVQRGKHWHITTTPFDLTFECSTPFGQELKPTAEGGLVSDLVYTASLNNNGNADAKVDIIMIFNAATDVTKINFNNTTSDSQIQLETAISAGDIVMFSGSENKVTLNGAEQDFAGTFINANVGANNYTLTVTGTSVEYELTTNTPINHI